MLQEMFRCCCIYGGTAGIPRDALSLQPPPVSSACPAPRAEPPAAQALSSGSRHGRWRRFPALLGSGRCLCSCRERERTQPILSSRAGLAWHTGNDWCQFKSSPCQPYLSRGTPHNLLPAPGNEEISQGQLLWPPKIWVTKISTELNTRGGWQVG